MNMIECPYCHTRKKFLVECSNCGRLSMAEGINRLALELGHDPTLAELGADIFKRAKLKEIESMK